MRRDRVLVRCPAFRLSPGSTLKRGHHARARAFEAANWIFLRLLIVLLTLTSVLCPAQETNLVANGSFTQSQREAGVPDDWSSAGNPAVKQQLTLEAAGRDGPCAKLVCIEFAGDQPDSHAMLCQVGKVSVQSGRWYRLTFWAKAEGIRGGSVDVALSDTRRWENAGLAEVFTPSAKWQPFDFLFRASMDLPATASRLQFWFKSAGTLWLDHVVLAESATRQQWFPQISTEGVKNFIPNSSFECGAANWGSYTYGLSGWAGNLYRLEGQVDDAVAQQGSHSLRIALRPETLPVFYWDYYHPTRQPVERVLAANQGWFRVKPGETLTLSAFLRADAEDTAALLVVNEAPDHLQRKQVRVGKQWQRFEFTFTPANPYLFIAVGLDQNNASLWIDSVQLERGDRATAYEPRHPVESFIETGQPGNIFTNPAAGMGISIKAFNNTDQPRTVRGKFEVTDFFDRVVLVSDQALDLPAHHDGHLALPACCKEQQGFFRATWTGSLAGESRITTRDEAEPPSSLRCALITPAPADLSDSPFGFNHAYPWDFLVRLARQAGIVWWRDWSAQWQTVEPAKGRFDFSTADNQILRVLNLDSQVEVLLPFPSASWATSARMEEVEKAAGRNEELRSRLPLSYAPKDLNDFGAYAAEVARHYEKAGPRAVTHYQILNEPIYTDYALPRGFGYTLADYLRLLETASRALHAADAQCRVIGGISASLDAGLTRDFVTQGGLQWVDIFDLHLYDPPRPAESFEESFSALEELVRSHSHPSKPMWITEFGCYADDDPPCLPQTAGDPTMNRCLWPSEQAATEHIVKFAAVAFAHGVRKIFFHAGTCGTINGPDAAGVLFEYGGAPRKMYAGVAALTRLLGVPVECVKRLHQGDLVAYVFRVNQGAVAIAWSAAEVGTKLNLAPGVRTYDIMGNLLQMREVAVRQVPIYLADTKVEPLLVSLGGK